MNPETFEGAGGLNIFFRSWTPTVPSRGVVVIVHGFNSHSGQYAWPAEQLELHGLAVYALDLRGRGQSDGERFFVQRIDEYVDDVFRLIGIAKGREPGRPVFLLGHSAGGVVACICALDHPEAVDGLICESFAYDVPAPGFALSILKAIGRIAPHARVFKLKNEHFSRDPAAVSLMNRDPLIAGEVEPAQTVAAMLRADARLTRDFGRITLPLLILHGTNDKATRPSGSRYFFEHAGSSDKTLKLYEGAFHDLLNDVDKQVVLSDIGGWIERRLEA